MKNKANLEDSDEFDIDEPEDFEESGSDWDPDEEELGKKRKGKSKRIGLRKSTQFKKKKTYELQKDIDKKEAIQGNVNVNGSPDIALKAFKNRSFVVLKSDFEAEGDPPLWKIDGKALLQKYIPFQQNGKTLYRNTSTYSGWTESNQRNYAPASVTYVHQGKKEIIVEFNREVTARGNDGEESSEAAPPSTT